MIEELQNMQKILLKLQQTLIWIKTHPKMCLVLLIILFGLTRCHHHEASAGDHSRIVTVESHPLASSLYYAGTIQPLKAIAVISPADGVIEDMPFHYGDTVAAGHLLFTINSEKFQADYKTALVQYVKARSDLSNNQNQLYQGEFLHKNKLISDDEFKIRQTNFYTAQLAFVQAKDSLGKMLGQLDLPGINLYDVSISEIEKINKALHMQGNEQKLRIMAPSSGVALLPVKIDSSGVEKKMGKGEQVKQGDVLALIGDGKGISVRISINEFDINQIKTGQHVKVSGAAFPDSILEGSIAGVDHQAQANQSGMPNFSADIVVPALTPAQQKTIYVGMSAKVEVDIEEPAQVTVPLAAVTEKNGNAYVKLQDPKTGALHDQLVKTGKTTTDSVVILDSLKAGDKIAVAY
jgi:multidrug efflux pump subunit AcrA (membrane-fusion protein)